MNWKNEFFKWAPETIDTFRKSLGAESWSLTDDELCDALNTAMRTQRIDVAMALANDQIEELLTINDKKWEVIDALLEGDPHKALGLMKKMSGRLKKTLSSELLTSHAVTENSNVVQFRRQK